MSEIRLDSPVSCVQELERCSNGLALLTQEITSNIEELAEAEEEMQRIESKLYENVRLPEDAKNKVTAAEIHSRVVQAVTADARTSRLRKELHELRAQHGSLKRRLKTLEERGNFAQSALAKHRDMERITGYGGTG